MTMDTPALPDMPKQPLPPPMFGEQRGQKKQKPKGMQPTFLGTGTLPDQMQLGQKTLLGT